MSDQSSGDLGYSFQGGIPAQQGAPTGLNQSVLVIYVRASDDNTSNLVALRTSEQAEFGPVAQFYQESSFGQLSFAFTHAPATGWYQLPKAYDDYMWTQADIASAQASGSAQDVQKAKDGQNLVQDFWSFFTDSLQAAQSDGFNVPDYSQVVVVIIGPFHRGTSYGSANFTLTNTGGQSFQVSRPVVVVSTNTGWSRTAHELGHAFGHFADLYGAPNRPMGPWDLMDCTDCGSQTSGWHKDKVAGWYSGQYAGLLKSLPRPTGLGHIDDTTVLAPFETATPAPGAVLSLRLDATPGVHLYVENRQKLAGQVGSQNLPENAVIISDADDNAATVNATRMPILLFGGPLHGGMSFTDQTYGSLKIEVSEVAASPQALKVRTQWGPEPYFDLRVDPWTPPPWESPDIWIDSQVNGWDVYEYTDASGQPIRNGDRPQVGRNNRVYARVHNDGTIDANNVRVSFLVSTPPAIGDTGNWTLLDHVIIPSIPAGQSAVTPPVNWRPSVAGHTCIKALVDYQAGELNANNNAAQENVGDFNTTSSSPWHPVRDEVEVSNSTPIYQTVRIEMTGLPEGWTGRVSQRFIPLAPNETKRISYSIDPGEGHGLDPGSRVDVNVVGWVLAGDQEVPLGGVTAAVHLVRKGSIVLDPVVGREVSLTDLAAAPGHFGGHIVADPHQAGLPVALEVRELDGDAYSMATGVTNSHGYVFLRFDALEGDLVFREGGRYAVRALLYGSDSVDQAVSNEREFVVTA